MSMDSSFSGYLIKRAMKSGRNWKKRYFVLDVPSKQLVYYKKPGGAVRDVAGHEDALPHVALLSRRLRGRRGARVLSGRIADDRRGRARARRRRRRPPGRAAFRVSGGAASFQDALEHRAWWLARRLRGRRERVERRRAGVDPVRTCPDTVERNLPL